MSFILQDIRARTIFKDQGIQEWDGNGYAHIPFDCTEEDDVIITPVDSGDYILKHKKVFDSLGSGYTRKNECVIVAGVKPDCDIQVEIEKLASAKGGLIQTPEGELQWVPDAEEEKPESKIII